MCGGLADGGPFVEVENAKDSRLEEKGFKLTFGQGVVSSRYSIPWAGLLVFPFHRWKSQDSDWLSDY